jgi:hypothetical protein
LSASRYRRPKGDPKRPVKAKKWSTAWFVSLVFGDRIEKTYRLDRIQKFWIE